MTNALVLHDPDKCFDLAARIARSNLIPAHYRGKEADVAIAMLYGAEMGLPPMTSLQRVVVVSGKPTLDAQGMVSLIRSAGHSLTGDVSAQGAKLTGRRADNGDAMTVEWGPEDAKRAGLHSDTYGKFPKDMYWARAVSQLGRRLFADVLLGVSYTPDEMQAVVDSRPAPASEPEPTTTRRPPPQLQTVDEATGEITGDIVDAEEVEDAPEPAPEPSPRRASPNKPASDKQLGMIKALGKQLDLTPQDLKAIIDTTVGRETDGWADLSSADASSVIDALKKAELDGPPPSFADEEPF